MRVYQCDRCKAIFEPRILNNGEPYITHKGKAGDVDLCPVCYDEFLMWLTALKRAEERLARLAGELDDETETERGES